MNVPRVALVVAPSLATAAAVVTDGRWLERVAWPGVPVTLACSGRQRLPHWRPPFSFGAMRNGVPSLSLFQP